MVSGAAYPLPADGARGSLPSLASPSNGTVTELYKRQYTYTHISSNRCQLCTNLCITYTAKCNEICGHDNHLTLNIGCLSIEIASRDAYIECLL